MTNIKPRRVTQKIDAFVEIVKQIASLSASSKLKVGCIIFKEDFSQIESIGYNGAYSNAPVYDATGTEEESLEPGQSGFIHAEINASVKFRAVDASQYIVLVTASPCSHCAKVLVNAGFRKIFWVEEYRLTEHLQVIADRTGCIMGDISKLYEYYGVELATSEDKHTIINQAINAANKRLNSDSNYTDLSKHISDIRLLSTEDGIEYFDIVTTDNRKLDYMQTAALVQLLAAAVSTDIGVKLVLHNHYANLSNRTRHFHIIAN